MRVLLLEDDERLQGLIVRALRQDGHAVDPVDRMGDARWMLGEIPYDAAVLDVMVPDGVAFDLCAELRAHGNWVPVLFLTARGAVEDRVRGLDSGGDDYLVKPFALAELMARLRSLTRRTPAARPSMVAVGDLLLDPATHRVTAGGHPLDVTPRQFALLEFLMRRPDVVVTRSEVVDAVWDWAFEGSHRIVDVYVRSLRELLGSGPARPRLGTVRGVGYRLVSPRPGDAAVAADSA